MDRLLTEKAAKAAVALVLAGKGQARKKILFIRRAASPKDPWSGQIALPGGRREKNDKDEIETAIRETREETGLDLAREDAAGRLPDASPVGKGLPPVVIRPVLFDIDEARPVNATPEADEAFWLDARGLPDRRGRTRVRAGGDILDVEAYLVEGRVIWGATFRILETYFARAASG